MNCGDFEIEIAAVCAAIGLVACRRRRKHKRRSVRVKLWILQPETNGAFQKLLKDLAETDPVTYKNYVRMV